jgi:hypothetical protein
MNITYLPKNKTPHLSRFKLKWAFSTKKIKKLRLNMGCKPKFLFNTGTRRSSEVLL